MIIFIRWGAISALFCCAQYLAQSQAYIICLIKSWWMDGWMNDWISSVQFSRSVVSDSLWPPWIAARQASLSITNSRSSLTLTSIESVMRSRHHILCCPLLLLPPNPSQHQSLFQWVNSSHEVAKVLKFQPQHHSLQNPRADLLQNGLVGSPCSPRDSQESSPTPQFKSINSSMLSFLYSPTLTSIYDYWNNYSLDWTELCWQSNVSAF